MSTDVRDGEGDTVSVDVHEADTDSVDSPSNEDERRQSRRDILRRIVVGVIALVLVGCGALVMFSERVVREFEVRTLVWIGHELFGSEMIVAFRDGNPSIAFPAQGGWVLAVVTIQCAIALYLGPIIALGGFLALRRGVRLGRVMVATAAGVVGMMVLSLLRLGLLVWAWGVWGIDAFRWVHGPVGTVMMLLGMAGALILMVFVAFASPPGTKPAVGRRAAPDAATEAERD